MSVEMLTVLAGLGIAVIGLAAATFLVRRATRERGRLQAALRDLGVDLGRRLDDGEVDPHVATAFNQTARDLEVRIEQSERRVRRLRSLAGLLGDRVAIVLDDDGEVRDVVGDLEALTGHSPATVLGRHASFFFASEDTWDGLREKVDDTVASVPLRLQDGEIVEGGAAVLELDLGHALILAAEAPPSPRDEEAERVRLEEEQEREAERIRLAEEQARHEEERLRLEKERAREAERARLEAERARLEEERARQEAERLRQIEEVNREHEERLLTFLGALPEAVAIVVDGRIASVNQRFAELCRLEPEALRGRPVTGFVAPRDLVRAAGFLAKQSDLPDEEVDLTLVTPTGNEVTVAMRAGRTRLEERSVLVLTARNVGARRDSEQRLGLYSAWLGATLEASRDGLAVLAASASSGEWPVVLANRAFLRALDLPVERLPGQSDLHDAVNRVFADGETVWTFLSGFGIDPRASGEGEFETAESAARVLRLEASPVLDEDDVVGRMLSLRDVTERSRLTSRVQVELDELRSTAATLTTTSRALEESNERSQRELEALRKLNGELKELDEMKSNLLGNVSHELQTPLVSIKGYTEMMLRGDLGPISAEQRQGLEVSRRNIQRLIGLIDQILTFTRTEERLAELTLEPFPLWEVIEETINLLGDRIKQKALRVTTRYKTDDLTVMADRDLVSQVAINLVGNAVKFNRDGGEVAVSVRAAGPEELVVEIRDTGPGIPREEHERIFERGFRGASAGGTRGSGIGLSVVREILRRHGCQIRVDSRPGEGTTFSFTLPLAAAPDEDPPGQPPAS